jgi:hypothetical protein
VDFYAIVGRETLFQGLQERVLECKAQDAEQFQYYQNLESD